MVRKGPFWDVMAGREVPPPAAALLGWELVSVDPDAGTIEVAFTATEQFLNPAGVIQGGFLAAMLDDTLGPALVATLGPGQFAPTTDLHVQFLRPARPGRADRAWPGRPPRQQRGVPRRGTAGRIRPDGGGSHRDGADPNPAGLIAAAGSVPGLARPAISAGGGTTCPVPSAALRALPYERS